MNMRLDAKEIRGKEKSGVLIHPGKKNDGLASLFQKSFFRSRLRERNYILSEKVLAAISIPLLESLFPLSDQALVDCF